MTELPPINDSDIAIIGMACRFPDAVTIDDFWRNIRDGVESISFFSDEELIASGIEPATLEQSNYVKAGGVLSDIELFDAEFFGFSPREAAIMDPQQRVFLECAWEALESAGHAIREGDNIAGSNAIGVYAGASMSTYLRNNLYPYGDDALTDGYSLFIGNGQEFLSTRVSYKLNLTGPSVNVQTACSTSLVAVHMACQSLLNGECDMALAGGVYISVPQKTGYWYQEGMILSPDGHCRAFDAEAKGTVVGDGAGVVVLKPLEAAIADGDTVHAVIKGSAINNDGALKVGYTAPSVAGQAAAISEAQAMAHVTAETIRYIEAHGTGTSLGDPVEIAALTRAFRETTEKSGFCAIGALKANIGHTDAAAGVAGLIKTVLALKNRQIPPSLHFKTPNPKIDFVNSPFYVNAILSDWKTDGVPRRAGVSSFGLGGTNAHVIVEEPPEKEPSGGSRDWQLLVLSARTKTALESATERLATHLEQDPDNNLADVAYTLSHGRKAFEYRRMVVCRRTIDAKDALGSLDPTRVATGFREGECPVVFMFSGHGTQYIGMGRGLYESEPVFREVVDGCSTHLESLLGYDLRRVLYPEQVDEPLSRSVVTQPALFVVEYALARLWMSWGVHPEAMIGHSMGEYVAACLSRVFSLEDALSLVVARERMMESVTGGAMLSVLLPFDQIPLEPGLSLAIVSAPDSCVISGLVDAIDALESRLVKQEVECRRLDIAYAAHSEMMETILPAFTEQVAKVERSAPRIPYVSNVTGTWITAEDATDPGYWARHLRQTVRFADGVQALVKEPSRVLLEVGPGRVLATLARRHPDKAREQVVLSSLRHPEDQESDSAFLLNTAGRLWLVGAEIDWSGFYAHERRQRLPLPTYPFEHQRYWIDPPGGGIGTSKSPAAAQAFIKKSDIADWFYIPYWKPSVLTEALQENTGPWLIFEDAHGLGSRLVERLRQQGQTVITVKVGPVFAKQTDDDYTLNPQFDADYETLIGELGTRMPRSIVHCWCVTPNGCRTIEEVDKAQGLVIYPENPEQNDQEIQIPLNDDISFDHFGSGFSGVGFYSLLFLAQALGKRNVTDEIRIAVVSSNMQAVTGEEDLHPEKATVLGPVRTIGQEYPNLACRSIDIAIPASEIEIEPKLIDQLVEELISESSDLVVAYRGVHRWVQEFEPIRLERSRNATDRLREKGLYLITGGLGGIGLTLAEHLARTVQARLVLIGRSAFPAREEWDGWLVAHDESNATSHKIRKLQALEALGAEILVASADVADLQQMQEVIAKTERRFGPINGVIHSAGIAGDGVIQIKTMEIAESVLLPKVKGALVLDYLLKGIELDFFVLCSALNSILSIFGQVDYCAANAFLDAFSHKLRAQGVNAKCINWGLWQEVGMAVDMGVPLDSLRQGMLSGEGVDVFDRIMGNTLPQVLVSTWDLLIQSEQGQVFDIPEKDNLSQTIHERPELGHAYVPPTNQIEKTLADIWQKLLGIEKIGVHDDFFELGGDSLIMMRLVARIRRELNIEAPLQIFFENSKIKALAGYIDTCSLNIKPAEMLQDGEKEFKV
uniref:Phenolphthiocerol/phthiocerol polyketide synthase subunit E n=1 Tax=Candidatus Kentrum sp. FW TaxID=2126338 RepID=A0A450TZG3_9GAMM|nr:MAG: Acyl transferase domain-containing protein [Candidatus Kentron sp. FW]